LPPPFTYSADRRPVKGFSDPSAVGFVLVPVEHAHNFGHVETHADADTARRRVCPIALIIFQMR